MKITELEIKFGHNGRSIVKVWLECHTVDDVDEMIAWLQMARRTMKKWEQINAKTSRAAQTAAGKNETAKPGQVQGEPQVA